MADTRKRSVPEMLADSDLMTAAIQKGVREELLSQARAGNSVPYSKDGQIVWLTPPEIFARLGYVAPANTKAS